MKVKVGKNRATLRFFWVNYADIRVVFLSVRAAHCCG